MVNPQFVEEKPVSLVDVKELVKDLEKRDGTLSYASTKVKEYLEQFVTLSQPKKEDLHKKLVDLKLTRLREEHFVKIIDFLPATAQELKVVLQAYPLSLSKKDQESILEVVKQFAS